MLTYVKYYHLLISKKYLSVPVRRSNFSKETTSLSTSLIPKYPTIPASARIADDIAK